VAITENAALRRNDGTVIDLTASHPADGFSPGSQILALIPEALAANDLATYDPAEPERCFTRSVQADNPTVIVEASSGRRIPHIAEFDPRARSDARRALVLRPLERLRPGTRHVIGLRLRRPDGTPAPVPEGFRAIRAGAGVPADLAALSERYEREVFPLLDAIAPRAEWTLAWDFTTGTDEHLRRTLLAVRDDVIARVRARPPAVRVVEVLEDTRPHVARRVELSIQVPAYVDSAAPGARLRLGPDGLPRAEGTVEVPVLVVVPPSALDVTRPQAQLLQFGHGFFGRRGEIHDGFAPVFGDEHGFVVMCTEWWGMSADDLPTVIGDITERTSEVMRLTDRLHQAMANQIALAAARNALAGLPELQRADGSPVFAPHHVAFYGLSLGHILGGTYVALSPDIDRALLAVGGANFSFMMFRARPFDPFLNLVDRVTGDALDHQIFAALTQLVFDRVDPLTYADLVLRRPLPGSPDDRRILMHLGIGDAEVPNVATELHARELGLSTVVPSPRPVVGLAETSAEGTRSGLVLFDFGIDPLPGADAIPPTSANVVHEGQRELASSMAQASAFLRPGGTITQVCDGPCDPE
jgi:hypothetical protein